MEAGRLVERPLQESLRVLGVEVIQDEGRAQTGRGPGEVAGTTHRKTDVTTEGK